MILWRLGLSQEHGQRERIQRVGNAKGDNGPEQRTNSNSFSASYQEAERSLSPALLHAPVGRVMKPRLSAPLDRR